MANTAAAITERTNQENYIVSLLKRNPGKKFHGKDICENLGISQQRKRTLINGLKPKYPQLRTGRGGNGGVYYWEGTADMPALDNKKPEKASVNAEGYSDPTAGTAIDKVDKEIERKASLPKMGEVWSAKHQSGSIDLFYILWSTDTQASGIYLDSDANVAPNPPDENVALTNRIFATLANHKIICVATKPIKYLLDKVGETNGIVMSRVKNTIARQLDIKPVVRYEEKEKIVYREKPVEKIVTKVVEKPVEKIVYRDQAGADIPETYIRVKDAIINDLLHQIEIYKDMLDRLIPVRAE